VSIGGDHAMAVVNNNGISQQAFSTDKGNHAGGGSQNRCAVFGCDIITFVELTPAGKRPEQVE
jgi:hypothetical protein